MRMIKYCWVPQLVKANFDSRLFLPRAGGRKFASLGRDVVLPGCRPLPSHLTHQTLAYSSIRHAIFKNEWQRLPPPAAAAVPLPPALLDTRYYGWAWTSSSPPSIH
jgi:hypothetical protein